MTLRLATVVLLAAGVGLDATSTALRTDTALQGQKPGVSKKKSQSESIEVKVLGFRPLVGRATAGQPAATGMTNPKTGTTCTIRILPGDPRVDPKMVREARENLDPKIRGSFSPCVQ